MWLKIRVHSILDSPSQPVKLCKILDLEHDFINTNITPFHKSNISPEGSPLYKTDISQENVWVIYHKRNKIIYAKTGINFSTKFTLTE